MGSPAAEPERSEDEVQHEVTLSEGFWLGDTACPQALWTAVMGANPSRFEGARRPVETVSWEDCQEFLRRTEVLSPGLGLSLPTEAQWEYACRAGTRTPFWFGETITAEQVNFNAGYPYAGGATGAYRGQTLEVKSLPCNGWGLYEMHGNVWEWCADWYEAYAGPSCTDPEGPRGGVERVLRGGSWNSDAAYARSAPRNHSAPSLRSFSVGLRVSRGRTSMPTAGRGRPERAEPAQPQRRGPVGEGGEG